MISFSVRTKDVLHHYFPAQPKLDKRPDRPTVSRRWRQPIARSGPSALRNADPIERIGAGGRYGCILGLTFFAYDLRLYQHQGGREELFFSFPNVETFLLLFIDEDYLRQILLGFAEINVVNLTSFPSRSLPLMRMQLSSSIS